MQQGKRIAASVPKGQLAVWWAVRIALFIWCVDSVVRRNGVILLQGAITLASTFLWSLFQRFGAGRTIGRIPCRAQTLFTTFVFFSSVLGNALGLFWRFEPYDKIMHFLSGILVAWIAYDIAALMQEKGGKVNPALCALLAFFASAGVAACWEIHEFTMDHLLGLQLQRSSPTSDSGLIDTMLDIIFGTVGGAVTTMFLALRGRRKNR